MKKVIPKKELHTELAFTCLAVPHPDCLFSLTKRESKMSISTTATAKKVDQKNTWSERTGKKAAKDIIKEGHTPGAPGVYAEMMLETITFDSSTGKRLSKPYQQTFNEKEWPQFLQFRAVGSFAVVEILYLPKGWEIPPVSEI